MWDNSRLSLTVESLHKILHIREDKDSIFSFPSATNQKKDLLLKGFMWLNKVHIDNLSFFFFYIYTNILLYHISKRLYYPLCVCLHKYFLSFWGISFYFLDAVHWSVFLWFLALSVALLRNHCLRQGHEALDLCFLLFYILAVIFRSLIHFWVNFCIQHSLKFIYVTMI